MHQSSAREGRKGEDPAKSKCRIGKNKKEIITYQSEMLHYGLYTPDPQKASFTDIPWHWHDEFEFGHIIQGSILYKTNHHEFTLKKGDGIFVNSGTLHHLQPLESPAGTALRTQFFDQSFLAGYPGSIYDVKYIVPVQETKSLDAVPLYLDNPSHAGMLEKIRKCEEICLNKEPFFELRIRSIFSELWETVYSWAQEQKRNEKAYDPAEDERIKQMLSLIRERYGEKITVADLALTAHISERECYRLFRQYLRQTPNLFLQYYRVQKAKNLLCTTQMPVTEISSAAGFESISCFSKIFKRLTNMTPSEFRSFQKTQK